MMELGKLVANPEAMKRFGSTMVIWDLKAFTPKKVLAVPGAPLEIRWSLKEGDNWAITATALTSKLWLVKPDANGGWQAKEVATIGDPAKIPLPVDISIRNDGTGLWVNTFMDGKTRYFDLTNPEQPRQTYEKATGKQVNMISQSWDGTRVYISSSLLARWDKAGADRHGRRARRALPAAHRAHHRQDHAPELRVHALPRRVGLSARLPGLRRGGHRGRAVSCPALAGEAGDALLRSAPRYAGGDAAICRRAGGARHRLAIPHHALGAHADSPARRLRAGRPRRRDRRAG